MTSSDKTNENAPQATGKSFEEAIQELENIIQRMSTGEQTLETSINEFERGIQIARECQTLLKQAHQRVEVLTKSASGELETQPFEPK